MRLALSDEQRQFGASLHELLADAGVPAAARAWAAGDPSPGLVIWRALANAGVTALAVPESGGGLGASLVDVVVACEELGHHPVPGPIAESVAAVPALLAGLAEEHGSAAKWLAELAEGELIATIAMPPTLPYALDADVAGLVVVAEGGSVRRALPQAQLASIDAARRLFEILPAEPVIGAAPARARAAVAKAMTLGTLASAALLLGAGRGLLETTAEHARTRVQFGRPIGAFQAVKHALADVLIGLEFARPLVYAAAIAVDEDAVTAARDVAAARVASADAANRAARTALQVHGAIGYTRECDVSLWLAKVRALSSAWGSQAEHRATVLAALAEPETDPWS